MLIVFIVLTVSHKNTTYWNKEFTKLTQDFKELSKQLDEDKVSIDRATNVMRMQSEVITGCTGVPMEIYDYHNRQ